MFEKSFHKLVAKKFKVEPDFARLRRDQAMNEHHLEAHEMNCLCGAFEKDGDLRILALPSSQTGTRLIRSGLAKAINFGPSPYGYFDCGDLIATDLGREVISFVRGVAFVRVSRVPDPPFTPGDSAFWLDPHLWDRTPTLPDGRPDLCWKYA